MRKIPGKIVIMCISVAAVGGCGRESGISLEDMQFSILPAREDGEQNGVPESNQGESSRSGIGGTSGADAEGSREDADTSDSNRDGDASDPMIEAYITILEDIFFEQKFPGDEDYGYQPVQEYDVAANQFAVYDIDGDGIEELLLTWTTTYTAGQVEIIYGYDNATGSITEELRAYPLLTYYDNGVVEEQMSHNHGMAPDGDFWPYILYQYDDKTDQYTVIASVNAWSRAYREEDYDGNPFPEEVDADGDGMVYYIMEGGTYILENPLDGAEYQLWRDSCIKGAQPIQVSYVKLTPDNIYALGSGTTGADAGGRGYCQ